MKDVATFKETFFTQRQTALMHYRNNHAAGTLQI